MKAKLLTAFSTLFVGIGVALLVYFSVSVGRSIHGHDDGIEQFMAMRAAQAREELAAEPSAVTPDDLGMTGDTVSEPERALPSVEAPDQTTWSEKRIAEYEALAAAAGNIAEGIMRIPSVDLELPVFHGTAETSLTRGAGRIEGTPALDKAGNTGIAAHRDGYFRALKDVALGDRIEIETMSGVEQYRITDLLIVDPQDVHVLDPTANKSLTLVTCYPFYFVGHAPQRYIVRAEKM